VRTFIADNAAMARGHMSVTRSQLLVGDEWRSAPSIRQSGNRRTSGIAANAVLDFDRSAISACLVKGSWVSDLNISTEGVGCSRTRTAVAGLLLASADLPQFVVAVNLRATGSSSPDFSKGLNGHEICPALDSVSWSLRCGGRVTGTWVPVVEPRNRQPRRSQDSRVED
jgi:hypothetical protein